MSIAQVGSAGSHAVPKGGILRGVLNLFSNVWFGVLWAVLLFIYCSIGSAVPAVRQLPWLEMTEFQWFNWWPFNVLMIMLSATLVVTTVRRIPLRTVNLGVWMIHAGIIVLCAGSYYYFGTKVEGDTPVFRREVRIKLPKMAQAESLPALPGTSATVDAGPDRWRFAIQSTNSDWPILSDEHQGERAYAVNVRVTPPTGEPFVRQLLAGYPQYTEDVIPGKGRAIKLTQRRLLNEELDLSLDYAPQEYFHVQDTWALYVRRAGESEWSQRPIRGLPRYNDRIGSRDQVFADPHSPPPLRAIDLEVPPAPEGDALSSASVHITGYLRYAFMDRRWRDGGERLNPVAHVSVLSDHAEPRGYELAAFDRGHNTSEGGMVELRWLNDFSEAATLPTDSRAVLHVAVPETKFEIDVPISAETVAGRDGAFTPIGESGFSYRILSVQDNLAMPGGNTTVSVAMVEIKAPDGVFTRMVADQPRMTRDMRGDNPDPHAPSARTPEAADPRIVMTYRPQSAPIVFAAYPQGLFLAVNGPSGRVLGREVKVGETVEVVPGLSVRADAYWPKAVPEVKPAIVPRESRQRDAGETYAMIRLELGSGSGVQSRWLRFNQYAFPDERYAYAGRFAYAPEQIRLADGTDVEVLFSRERRQLPSAIGLDSFALDTHLGGYTGQALTIRNYVSALRFRDGDQWTDPQQIRVNGPTEHGGYWYFQSMWDKPPSSDPNGGMNYTGLGVGNRNGVYVQLAGCCLSVAGMLFAFYVKPVLKRRRHEHSRAKVSGFADEAMEESVFEGETVRV